MKFSTPPISHHCNLNLGGSIEWFWCESFWQPLLDLQVTVFRKLILVTVGHVMPACVGTSWPGLHWCVRAGKDTSRGWSSRSDQTSSHPFWGTATHQQKSSASPCVCLKTKGHCTLSPKFSYAFFLFLFFRNRHPFLSICLLRMRKHRKSNLIQKNLWRTKVLRQCVNVIDTTWGCIYFLTCENFRLGVQWP